MELKNQRDYLPSAAPYKVRFGRNLYLLVTPKGDRYWRADYHFGGKRNTLSLGKFPDVDLAAAQAKHDEMPAMLREGLNPSEQRKKEKAEALGSSQAAVQNNPQTALPCFSIDSDGALCMHLKGRQFRLSPAETAKLRVFLDATRAIPAATPIAALTSSVTSEGS